MFVRFLCAFSIAMALSGGCTREPAEAPATNTEASMDAAATNRVDIPAVVRGNLGITFARVEARHVSRTMRIPGRFEWAPTARREYRAMLRGRVEFHVQQYAAVETGALLYTLDSPAWRDLQQRLNESESQWRQARARLASYAPLMMAHDRHHQALEQSVSIWEERLAQLEHVKQSGVISDEEFARVRVALAGARAELAEVMEKEALLQAQRIEAEAERDAARQQHELLLLNAGSLLGVSTDELTPTDPATGHPRWREIRLLETRAGAPGRVESIVLTSGSWASESDLVLTTVQPDLIRFRAMGMQSDLSKYQALTTARIVPGRTPGLDISEAIEADLVLGLEARPEERVIALIATPKESRPWARAGVSAFLEVVAESSGGRVLAIPRSAVVRDGLVEVFFRRDPADPNKAIRVEADLGVDDGRWVEVHSGLMLGDEVVLDGVYELKLATAQSGATQKGGHFHADGTFHEEH